MVSHCSDRRVSPSGPHRKRGNRAKMAAQAVRIGTIVVRKTPGPDSEATTRKVGREKRKWSPRDSEAAEVRRDGYRNLAEEEVWGLGDAAWKPVSWPEFGQVGVPSRQSSSPNPGIRITRQELGGGRGGRGMEKNGKGKWKRLMPSTARMSAGPYPEFGLPVLSLYSWLRKCRRRKTPCTRSHLSSLFTSLTFRFQLLSFLSFHVP